MLLVINIPLNKALVAVDIENRNFQDWVQCKDCFIRELGIDCPKFIACDFRNRKDGKNVIFKLVDWKEEK